MKNVDMAGKEVAKLQVCLDYCSNTLGCRSVMWSEENQECELMDIEWNENTDQRYQAYKTTYYQVNLSKINSRIIYIYQRARTTDMIIPF